jgi:hypothetical protein
VSLGAEQNKMVDCTGAGESLIFLLKDKRDDQKMMHFCFKIKELD